MDNNKEEKKREFPNNKMPFTIDGSVLNRVNLIYHTVVHIKSDNNKQYLEELKTITDDINLKLNNIDNNVSESDYNNYSDITKKLESILNEIPKKDEDNVNLTTIQHTLSDIRKNLEKIDEKDETQPVIRIGPSQRRRIGPTPTPTQPTRTWRPLDDTDDMPPHPVRHNNNGVSIFQNIRPYAILIRFSLYCLFLTFVGNLVGYQVYHLLTNEIINKYLLILETILLCGALIIAMFINPVLSLNQRKIGGVLCLFSFICTSLFMYY